MIDEEDMKDMKEKIESYQKKREELFRLCRDMIKESKLVIYSLHRGEKNILDKIKNMEKLKSQMQKIADTDRYLYSEGFMKMAFQEYAEAMLYHTFIAEGRLKIRSSLGIDPVSYIGGLADLTGELVRRAVIVASKGRVSEVVKIRDLVDGIYFSLLKINLPNTDIRKKFDSIKYNLRKLEDLVLDMKLKDGSR